MTDEALDMAMATTIHALCAFYLLETLMFSFEGWSGEMMRQFSFQWWESIGNEDLNYNTRPWVIKITKDESGFFHNLIKF